MSMVIKRMVPDPDGGEKKVEAVVVPVTEAQEPFSRISLEDGTVLSVRTTVVEVVRFPDKWDNDGNPIYNATFQTSVNTASPDELRKERQG